MKKQYFIITPSLKGNNSYNNGRYNYTCNKLPNKNIYDLYKKRYMYCNLLDVKYYLKKEFKIY